MSITKPTLVLGAPATGRKFWPRPEVVEKLQEALVNDHVLFPGPRRTGKTSILLHLKEEAKAPARAVLINAEKYSTAPQLIQGIAKAVLTPDLKKRATKLFKSSASKIKGIKVAFMGIDFHDAAEQNWEGAADALLKSLIETSDPVLIMIDEFSVFINSLSKKSPEEANRMLRWFREWRQRLVDTPVRFILTGSIGIDTVLRKLQLGDTVNDCRSVSMFPPAEMDSLHFLQQRAKENDIDLTDNVARRMLELIDPHWYYPLQIFLSEVKDWSRREGRSPSVPELDAIYRDKLVAEGNENLKHMWDKLSEIFVPDERRFARELMKAMTSSAKGMSRTEMEAIHTATFPPGSPNEIPDFEYVVGVLRHDGYLIQESVDGQRTRFASNLLRDYWARQHS